MPTRRSAALAPADDPVLTGLLNDALGRVQELSDRLWRVRQTHRPVRRWWQAGSRCTTCGVAYPCPTLTAAGPAPTH